jgi:exonuclease VII large subunit
MTLMPEQILKKGYTITRNERNELVSSVGQLQKRGIMVTEFIDGSARSIVQETEEKDGKAQS